MAIESAFKFPVLPEVLQPLSEAITTLLSKPAIIASPTGLLATELWQSKIGGNPYLPTGAANPLLLNFNDKVFQNYMMLMQINFEEMPALKGFPAKGILQFFTIDFVYDDNVRVVYYPEIITDKNMLVTDFSQLPPKTYPPASGGIYTPDEGIALQYEALQFSPIFSGPRLSKDSRCLLNYATEDRLEAVEDALEMYFEETLSSAYDEWQQTQPPFSKNKIQIGGNVAQFFNEDRREEELHFNQLLLEYDCKNEDTPYPLPLKGMDVTPQFFINSEKLKNADFSDFFFSCMM